ncbi:Uma2 family endonuclease [Rudanella paleaurantiibacter]|uniref:Uma2 family endonuclease n=1 Tax=Rudanella paleaurantiibacter TaxID=2614655 RepID=UPI001FEB9235|nr:Uma2 family endonuclease [Rudanella paleaurantiibacter]
MASITSLDQLDPNKQYTYADYLTWQFSERVELIWGYVRKISAPNRRHQKIVSDLHGNTWMYLRGKPCRVYQTLFDVRLPRKHKVTNEEIATVTQPDLCVISDPTKLDTAGCKGAPDWVIEVLSKGNTNKEMKEKFEAYEEAGVREYWIVQPAYDNVLVYTLQDGKFQA